MSIHDYKDIIQMPHPLSKNHAPMPRANRAAQFAPFAALTGHKEAICESERITDHRILLDEHKKALLNERLQDIFLHIKEHPEVKVTYFVEDERKEGGSYRVLTKPLKTIDELYHMLIFVDKTKISIKDIIDIEQLGVNENTNR